jgi:glycerol uptake facilitator-like aquaporin
MEKGLIKKPKLRSYLFMALFEFFGMVLFLVGINCSGNDASVASLGLFVAATLTGRVSGGHFNMAITFAVYVMEGKFKKNLSIALAVMIIDTIGAFTAMVISSGLLGSKNIFLLIPPGELNNLTTNYLLYLLLVEAFFTMIFISIVLSVKYRRVSATSDGMLSNLTVAIGLYVVVRMAGPLSGAGINPTIALACITSGSIVFGGQDDSGKVVSPIFLFPYIIGPLLGGLMAAGLQKFSDRIAEDEEI